MPTNPQPPSGAPSPLAAPPRELFAPPRAAPRRPAPLAARLAPLPRMVATLVVTLASAWWISAAFARAATVALPDSVPAPRMAVESATAATVLVLGGLWWWLDPVLVRAGFGAWSRFVLVALGCLVSALVITAFPALYVGFCPKPVAVSNDDARTVLAASMTIPLAAWVPGFWVGELVGALWHERRRVGAVSDGRGAR